ncbi:MAG: M15 family metallopeptidase [Brumimicrobium sp.]|nr:M15 family metallopeptidase [Brumimicrobium sp.]MCO5268992.1 M15 family metallopeptidase [Brumimicrobium sp.]
MRTLIVLRKGMKEPIVGDWQAFLRNLNLYKGVIDNDFGNKTLEATKQFQQKYKLGADGVVGPMTWAKAVSLGFDLEIEDISSTPKNTLNYPEKPSFPPLVSNSEREKLFGKIAFVANPTSNNPEGIKITNSFEKDNIVYVDLPQLSKATGGKYTRMRFHKLGTYQLQQFFLEIEKKNLLHLIKTYAGAYAPRFVRGSKTVLSNHSYGTAFDINVAWNGLGKTPALVGEQGSVRELVPIAHKWGFYWGGHFSRPDGMHFEVVKIIKEK